MVQAVKNFKMRRASQYGEEECNVLLWQPSRVWLQRSNGAKLYIPHKNSCAAQYIGSSKLLRKVFLHSKSSEPLT